MLQEERSHFRAKVEIEVAASFTRLIKRGYEAFLASVIAITEQ